MREEILSEFEEEKMSALDVFEERMSQFDLNNDETDRVFPANLVLEPHTAHSRWFLSSLVTSVTLAGHAPFRQLKT